MRHLHTKLSFFLAAAVLVGCSAKHEQAAPQPHRIFSKGQWPGILEQVGYTSLGVGQMRIHLDGKKTDEILSLLGDSSRRGRDMAGHKSE
jgi:hypothetical protein